MKNKTIAETLDHKIWKAVDSMIRGLEEYSKLPYFKIDMSTYGDYNFETNICYGCAATCALHKVANKEPEQNSYITSEVRLSYFTGFNTVDIINFESAINDLRYGGLTNIFEYMGKYKEYEKIITIENKFNLEVLTSRNWQNNLEDYKKLRDYLKTQDI